MNRLKKGENLKVGVVLSDNFFEKRREVMNIIYQARKYFPNAPRTEVKIMTKNAGMAFINGKYTIAIGEDVEKTALVHVVLHELLHTWLNVDHDENCPLMKSYYNNVQCEKTAWETFKKIITKK